MQYSYTVLEAQGRTKIIVRQQHSIKGNSSSLFQRPAIKISYVLTKHVVTRSITPEKFSLHPRPQKVWQVIENRQSQTLPQEAVQEQVQLQLQPPLGMQVRALIEVS